jgi:hypothetical protein
MPHKSDSQLTYGRKMTYLEATKSGFRKFLQHVADGDYWTVSQDFSDGSVFDSPAMQRAKAAAMIVEFDKKVAQIPNPGSLDGKTALMLLAFEADVKFSKSIRKPTEELPKTETQHEIQPTEAKFELEEVSNEPLTGEAKLRAAKDFAKGLQYTYTPQSDE